MGRSLGRCFKILEVVRVVFAIKSLNNPGGGAEKVFADVVTGLSEQGFELKVLTFDQPGASLFYPIPSQIERINLGIGDVTCRATFTNTVRRIIAMRKIIRAMGPDVVVGFMHSMFIPIGFSLVGTGLPLIASEHIVPQHYETRPLERFLMRLIPFLTVQMTCVSEQVRDLYPKHVRRKMRVINNPFSLKVLNQANLSGVEGARKVLLSVGSLREQKDHITLVRAFSQIAKRLPEWNLRIVGEGGMRKIIESEISLLGMQDRIFLKGATSRIHCEYEQAQLCVIPSKYESLGLTTLEALAHGLPVVGFDDCSGTNTLIVSGENGILVSGASERVENLARGLFLLMKDTNARTLLAKRTIPVGREYNISNVVEQWVQLIKETAEKQLN